MPKLGKEERIKRLKQKLEDLHEGRVMSLRDMQSLLTAEQTFRHFMNTLNRECYGNNWHRKSKHDMRAQIPVIATLEDGFGRKRIHYHCLFSRPQHLKDWQFRMLLLQHWQDTKMGGANQNKIEPIYDLKGAITYLIKEWRPTDASKLDCINTHVY